MPALLLFVVILSLALGASADRYRQRTAVNRYLSSLHLDPLVPPFPSHGGPLSVSLDFWLLNLVEADSASQSVKVTMGIVIIWNDDKLTWNSTVSTANITDLPTTQVWHPRLVLSSTVEGDVILTANKDTDVISILKNGCFILKIYKTFSFGCAAKVDKFPMDGMDCELPVLTTEDNHTVEFWTPFQSHFMAKEIINSEWIIVSVAKEKSVIGGSHEGEVVFTSVVYLRIRLQRRHPYYSTVLIVPASLLSFISVLIPLVDVRSGERLGFATSVTFTYFILLLLLDSILPKSGSSQFCVSVLMGFVMAVLNVFESVFGAVMLAKQQTEETGRWEKMYRVADRGMLVLNVATVLAITVANVSLTIS